MTYSVFCVSGVSNHVKSNCLNQASSDSELNKHRTRNIMESFNNLNSDLHRQYVSDEQKEKVLPDAKNLFLPSVQNMKHNVSEKVAQVIYKFRAIFVSTAKHSGT